MSYSKRHLAKLIVSFNLLEQVFKSGETDMVVRVGLPEDAVLVSAESDQDLQYVVLVFEHSSFEESCESEKCSIPTIRVSSCSITPCDECLERREELRASMHCPQKHTE